MEALEEGEITDKADIFAFGLTLWEMMTLAMPHLEMLEDDENEDEGEASGVKILWCYTRTLLKSRHIKRSEKGSPF